MLQPDPAEPISWALVEFLAERVRLIRTDAGFLTDIGMGLVVVDDSDVPDEFEGPSTVIEVDRITNVSGSRSQASSDVGVVIEFSVPRGDEQENPLKLVHRARKDLMRVLTFDSRDMPKGITKFEVTETNLATVSDDAGHSSVVAQITARAGLTEIIQPVSNP